MKTITISRQYGSGGRYIAALLSEKMGVPCYDSKFLPKEAERHGISQEIINEFKGKTSLLYAIGVMMSEESQDKKRLTIPEKMFHAQKETVKRLAQEGPCIFVGRCADQILKDDNQLLRVYIYASEWKTVLNGLRKISIFLRRKHLTGLHIKTVREEIIITFIQDMNGEKWKIMISA